MGARMDGVSVSADANSTGGLRNRHPGLSISTSRGSPAGGVDDCTAQEPVSPTARLMDDFYIVVSMGFGAPLNLPAFRAGIQKQLARYRRFRSIQTVNDVLVGVTSAALSRYYFRNSGDTRSSKLCVRSILFVNLRPTHSLQTYVNMIESGDSNDVKWGNRLGYIILPFHIAMHNDPLEYVQKAKKTVEWKKSSLEVIFTNMVTEFIIKILGAKAGAFIFNRMLKHISIAFSNVSGPTEQVVFCGHPVNFIAPSLYGAPEALFVHYQSYGSTMKVILAVDEAVFPDYHQLLDDFSESLRLIKGAASRLPATLTKND